MKALLASAVALSAIGSCCAQRADWLLDPSPYVARLREEGHDIVLENGLLRLRIRQEPLALVGIEQLVSGQQLLRATAALGEFTVDGEVERVGGMAEQPNRAFLLPEWLDEMPRDPLAIDARAQLLSDGDLRERFAWGRTRPASQHVAWPPRGRHVRWRVDAGDHEVVVNLELYDGLPLFCHWLEWTNTGDRPRTIDRFTSLRLPVVEAEARVEPQRRGVQLPNLYAETDFAFHAMTGADGSSHCVRWTTDPEYHTQVNYRKQTLCMLDVGPELGPSQTVAVGKTFATFCTWVLAPDSEDRERRSLAQRRMYRTIAPWSTESPLMMHVRSAAPDKVRAAIDQCAEVGFEMVILTFGSGFDIEDDSRENLDRWKQLADYAHARGVQLGGYSLLSSRRIEPDTDNCIHPETGEPGGQVFGYAPALCSDWGQRYFAKLRRFYEHTGFDLLEHDGSYPGDPDAMARPPLQRGYLDSRWAQHRVIAEFYRWCRARGVYLNVPDWYFLNGSSKTGMGYRETNWSLPRSQQVLHTRQNLFDGTREKNVTMGWMFVPLTQYHGGGAAATIEPLSEHLDHYRRMFESNLGYGAQACWRGPRLYDGDATR
ncbi:MAG: alpha-galactosidase, partial [Planctomycetes bacterium]|nr:alpha-galactosidase [Planctomycetota bacterium]